VFADGSECYLQGFTITGEPCTGVRETGHPYPEWMAVTAARNADNALRATWADKLRYAKVEEV
jgi:hypothetical protein